MRLVIETHRIDAPEINRGEEAVRSDALIGCLETSIVLFDNQVSLALIVKATETHGSGLIQIAEDPHPYSISKR